jgi:hypothetical protein
MDILYNQQEYRDILRKVFPGAEALSDSPHRSDDVFVIVADHFGGASRMIEQKMPQIWTPSEIITYFLLVQQNAQKLQSAGQSFRRALESDDNDPVRETTLEAFRSALRGYSQSDVTFLHTYFLC